MSDGNKKVVTDFFQALSGVDLDVAIALLSPDLVCHEMPPGVSGDRAGARQLFVMLKAAFPDLAFAVEDTVTEGDRIVARVRARGSQQGAFLDIPPTGKPVEYSLIEILRIADGKIAERWGVADWLSVIQQLRG